MLLRGGISNKVVYFIEAEMEASFKLMGGVQSDT